MEIPKRFKNNKSILRRAELYRVYAFLPPFNDFMKSNTGMLADANTKVLNYLIRHKLNCPFLRDYFLIDDKMKKILGTKKDMLRVSQIRDLVLTRVKLIEKETKYY